MSTSKRASRRLLGGIVSHGGRIGPLISLDDLATEALAPDGQLLDGGSAEGIAGGDQDRFAVVLEAFGEFGDGSRFAGAVDAANHHNGRPLRLEMNTGLVAQELLLELFLNELLDIAGDFLVEEGLPNALDDDGRGSAAHVGQIEALFQLLEEVLIDSAPQTEELGNAAEDAARLGQTLLDFVEDGPEHHVFVSSNGISFNQSARIMGIAVAAMCGWDSLGVMDAFVTGVMSGIRLS